MFGVALRDTGLPLSDLCALARAADDAGYSSIWLPEVGSRDAIVLAALIGSQTKNATIGTGVIPVFSRNVVSLSLAAAAAAEACDGRFVLGLGAGHRFTAEMWFGERWEHPRNRLRETVEVLREILSGKRVSHEGQVDVEGFHLSSSPPPVPVWLGALSPASLRLAGEIADGVICNWLTAEGVERASLLAREAAADAGREIKVVAYVRVAVTDDADQRSQARRALREHTYAYACLPAYAASLRNAGLGDAVDAVGTGDDSALDVLVDALCCWGEPDAVRNGLSLFSGCGIDAAVIYPVAFGEDPANSVLRTLRSLA